MPRHSSWTSSSKINKNKKYTKYLTNPNLKELVVLIHNSAPLGFVNIDYWKPILSQYIPPNYVSGFLKYLKLLPVNHNVYNLLHLYYSGYTVNNISRITKQERMNVTRRIKTARQEMVKLLLKNETGGIYFED